MSYRDGKRLNRMEGRANRSSCRYPQLPAGTKVGERSCAIVTSSRQILLKTGPSISRRPVLKAQQWHSRTGIYYALIPPSCLSSTGCSYLVCCQGMQQVVEQNGD